MTGTAIEQDFLSNQQPRPQGLFSLLYLDIKRRINPGDEIEQPDILFVAIFFRDGFLAKFYLNVSYLSRFIA